MLNIVTVSYWISINQPIYFFKMQPAIGLAVKTEIQKKKNRNKNKTKTKQPSPALRDAPIRNAKFEKARKRVQPEWT